MRNISNMNCRENENTYFMFISPPHHRRSCHLWDNAEKCGSAEATTDNNTIWRMRFACWTTKATNTHSEYVILSCFSTSTMAAQTRLSVTWYVHCPSCLIWGLVLSRPQFYVDLQSCFRQNMFCIFISCLVFRWKPLLYFNLPSYFRLSHLVHFDLRSF